MNWARASADSASVRSNTPSDAWGIASERARAMLTVGCVLSWYHMSPYDKGHVPDRKHQ